MDRLTSAFSVLGPRKRASEQSGISDGASKSTGSTQSKSKSSLLGKTKANYTKRRQQIYDAQKRHRNRKEDYIRDLESQIAELHRQTSAVQSEKSHAARENAAMQQLLASHGDLAGENVASGTISPDIFGMIGSHLDTEIDKDCLWVSQDQAPANVNLADSTAASSNEQPNLDASPDSWVALDFILALEWPCKDHVQHPATTGGAHKPSGPSDTGPTPAAAHGHALTMTSAVCACSRPTEASLQPPESSASAPPLHTQLTPAAKTRWQIPYGEIEKLISLASRLPLDPEEATPTQVYAAIVSRIKDESRLTSTLAQLKRTLAPHATCYGFGAVIPASIVQQELQSLL